MAETPLCLPWKAAVGYGYSLVPSQQTEHKSPAVFGSPSFLGLRHIVGDTLGGVCTHPFELSTLPFELSHHAFANNPTNQGCSGMLAGRSSGPISGPSSGSQSSHMCLPSRGVPTGPDIRTPRWLVKRQALAPST